MISYIIDFLVFCRVPKNLASTIVIAPSIFLLGYGSHELYINFKSFFERFEKVEQMVNELYGADDAMVINAIFDLSKAVELQGNNFVDIIKVSAIQPVNVPLIDRINKETTEKQRVLLPHYKRDSLVIRIKRKQ